METPQQQPPTTAAPGPPAIGASEVAGAFTTAGAQAPRSEAVRETPGAISVSGGQSQPRAAGDVGDLLGKSQESTGVELQRRTPITSDARIRGEHVGQVTVFSDGGFFFPARQDLDTAISKYDSSFLRDVILLKGPYSVLYGPGFSFLDVATLDAPRNKDGFDIRFLTNYGYQSNGERSNGTQQIWGGDADWGFRVGWGLRRGTDYSAGDGRGVPSSYWSQPINFAVGYSLDDCNRIEFKGLRLDQRDVEFAGLYFDINHLYTDAYALRYTSEKQQYFDKLNIDLWYNRTSANGDTSNGSKQAFLFNLLFGSFTTQVIPTQPPVAVAVLDHSFTGFTEVSRGYRLGVTWGEPEYPRLTVGSDMNFVNQQLAEFLQLDSYYPIQQFFGSSQGYQNLGIPNARMYDPGIFAEAVLPVGKRLTFKAGARGDWVETTSYNRFISGNIPIFFTPPASPIYGFDPIIFSSNPQVVALSPSQFTAPGYYNLNQDFALWSAYISGDYKIDQHLTVLGSFGYAQRPPTLTELYAAGPFVGVLQQGLDRLYGDPFLAPEKLKQMDIGLRADYGWFRGGVNGFYAWIDDYITFDLNTQGSGNAVPGTVTPSNQPPNPNPTGTNSQIAQVVFRNTDTATLAGGEVFSEVDVIDWLTTFGNVTYVQGRDLTHIGNSGNPNLASSRRTIDTEPLPAIPPLEGRVGLRLHEARRNPRWAIEGAVRLVAAQNLFAASLQEFPTPGFAVWDLRAYWQVNENMLLTAGVENIGDRFYREHLDPRAGDQMWRPGTNAYVGAQLQY
jgi:outer membrane receptor protein involved in Fe transport